MRIDVYLTEKGYAQSRKRAQDLIGSGCVTVDGKKITKASYPIEGDAHEIVIENDLAYVSRGGLKLEAALDSFLPSIEGFVALDVGASTGGFTHCMLSRGAKKVFAVDSGSGQLAKALREDPRVISMERFNARNLSSADIGGEQVDLIVMDVSFISATYIIPQFRALLKENGHAVCLIKPQFEVGRAMLGKGGIVKDPKAHRAAVERVMASGISAGLKPVGLIPSPVTGGDGNREFLICFTHGASVEKELTLADIPRLLF
ncbi:MAG: TlyA family RNA methyltransferase [Ruminococcaceae bacterium]|nr:TlyA family RNA methyltransferase [Oscillospiraceae bacterium]